jgi:hypothetical protein
MKKALVLSMLAALAVGVAAAQAGQGGNCSPEGTWYGYNTSGLLWIITITRSGPNSYTTVMDNGANLLLPGIAQDTDWRCEFVKTGSGQYDWTTMAYWRADDSGAFPPFVLGLSPLTAEFDGCDSWQGEGICDLYGFFDVSEDPFETGLYLGSSSPLVAFLKRMPMTFPTP